VRARSARSARILHCKAFFTGNRAEEAFFPGGTSRAHAQKIYRRTSAGSKTKRVARHAHRAMSALVRLVERADAVPVQTAYGRACARKGVRKCVCARTPDAWATRPRPGAEERRHAPPAQLGRSDRQALQPARRLRADPITGQR
jgi:hypothetical protein